jgi:hypothetical protein
VAALVGLAVGGLYLGSSMPLPQPQGVGDGILLAGSVLTAAIALPAAAGLAGLLLLAVPAVLLALLRAVADLVGNPRWVTDARRYALLPLLRMLVFATGLLVAGVWWYAGNAGWQGTTLLAMDASPGISVTLTLRGLALLLALALPYVLLSRTCGGCQWRIRAAGRRIRATRTCVRCNTTWCSCSSTRARSRR